VRAAHHSYRHGRLDEGRAAEADAGEIELVIKDLQRYERKHVSPAELQALRQYLEDHIPKVINAYDEVAAHVDAGVVANYDELYKRMTPRSQPVVLNISPIVIAHSSIVG
jgi:hypothetical protein